MRSYTWRVRYEFVYEAESSDDERMARVTEDEIAENAMHELKYWLAPREVKSMRYKVYEVEGG